MSVQTLTLVLVGSAWRAHQRQPLCFVGRHGRGRRALRGRRRQDPAAPRHGRVRRALWTVPTATAFSTMARRRAWCTLKGTGSQAAQQVPQKRAPSPAALGIQGDGSGAGAPGPETLAHNPGHVAVRQLSRSLRRKARACAGCRDRQPTYCGAACRCSPSRVGSAPRCYLGAAQGDEAAAVHA